MSRLKWLGTLMVIAIIAITGFQGYWLKNNYEREKQSLRLKTNTAFRETITKLQASKLRIENWNYVLDSVPPNLTRINVRKPSKQTKRLSGTIEKLPDVTVINLLQEKLRDSIHRDSTKSFIISYVNDGGPILLDTSFRRTAMLRKTPLDPSDSFVQEEFIGPERMQLRAATSFHRSDSLKESGVVLRQTMSNGPVKNQLFRLMYNVDSVFLKDSLTISDVDSAFKKRLESEKLNVPFTVRKIDSTEKDLAPEREVTLGFTKPVTFRLDLGNATTYFLEKLSLPILFSIFLVGISLLSFVLLYRGLLKQQRLVNLKDDFISNVSHELKTPIATMGVAIEALKNFNALNDTKKTKEYLDISEKELQRLNLLVDKVLKLSMFGKKEMDLKFEETDLGSIVTEVVNSMRLQIEKSNATVNLEMKGALIVEGDRIHLLSVVFNLLDNALKYRREQPAIDIHLDEKDDHVTLSIADNGIGIPPEYHKKIFEKFFRVPAGDTHNSKGHGLGLSYVSEVVRKHNGNIQVTSEPGRGTSLIVSLPKHRA